MRTENDAAEAAELDEQMSVLLAMLSDADRAEVLADIAAEESRRKERQRKAVIEELTIFADHLSL